MTGEIVAEKYHITRKDCDEIALSSHQKQPRLPRPANSKTKSFLYK